MGQDKVPLAGMVVPKHFGVASLTLESHYGVAGIDGESGPAVVARGETLHLARAGRGIHGYHGILAKSGGVFAVDSATAAEHRTEAVGLDCQRQVLPVYKVGRYRVAPGHVLPFRTIRVILIVEMPFPVFIEHSVGVVHPAVERRVVESRAIFLAVCSVKSIGQTYPLPAGIVLGLAHRATALRYYHVEYHLVSLVWRKVERHGIVGLRLGKTHIYCLSDVAVDEHVDFGIVRRLLNRQQHILTVACYFNKGIVYSEIPYIHAVCCRSDLGH